MSFNFKAYNITFQKIVFIMNNMYVNMENF